MRLVQAAGRRVVLVKSSIDTRYHSSRIVTHDGHSKVLSGSCGIMFNNSPTALHQMFVPCIMALQRSSAFR